ncbi:hypothetical protein, partial [Vibrio cholerae]|uniref:hypothetical protein n=1 Tax=Vibrio cholerae TaxID=666 RepID=UPI0034A0CE33
EAFLAEPVSLKTPLLVHAIHHCRHWLAKAKSTHHWLSFDDLLTHPIGRQAVHNSFELRWSGRNIHMQTIDRQFDYLIKRV